ncbi:MAG TPA: C4-type zinc ribbon domain-containing protein [Syntrophales bacterium]|nr:C4-type zinc ribbon domain-containing protein [Syntrophales bacterium]HOM06998.1 C4-type zinc ribbon domain-containing protein [Syntrophales bacterium]HON99602.1 C4-type zinc ribbon domain-containing protein [Syntrophales bacterium]HPC01095.1 C4-type zinc ribbon domain-containing protein [Syntrophales bacterium]HPQ06767.1 C4-type zinc ribbon domain-containing protein [Syntrophales bacterium]
MKEELPTLIELQRIDTEIVKINQRKRDLPLAISRLDEEFKALTAEIDEARSRQEDLVKRHREKENLLKRAVETLKKTKDRLTEVKTNKEYQAVLKEIETLEKRNGEIEEEIIVLLDEIDTGRGVLQEKEARYAARRSEYEGRRRELEGQLEAIDRELAQQVEKGESLRKRVPEGLLRKYEQIKAINNGLAVVSAWKEVCGGCHMNIPPQLYNELMETDEIVLCPNCNRIIFWYDQSRESA